VEIGEHFEQKAKGILADLGFTDIRDGPVNAPYDLTALKDGRFCYIEVKGTLSRKLGVTYNVQMAKLAALARLKNVLFLFIAGENAERWKLVEFEDVRDVSARVRLYSGKVKVGITTTVRHKVQSGNPPGRPRTLQGTRLIPLRIDKRLIELMDEQAGAEGISRQVYMSRILASATLRHFGTLDNDK